MTNGFLPGSAFTALVAVAIVGLAATLAWARYRKVGWARDTWQVIIGVLVLLTVLYGALQWSVLTTNQPESGFDQLAWGGLLTGSILALSAIGLTLVYGILNLSNFSHGDILTLGAYLAFMFAILEGTAATVSGALIISAVAGVVLLADHFLFRKLASGERMTLGAAAIVLSAGAIGLLIDHPLDDIRFVMPGLTLPAVVLVTIAAYGGALLTARTRHAKSTVVRLLPLASGAGLALALALLANVNRLTPAYIVAVAIACAAAAAVVLHPWARVHIPYVLGGATAAITFLYANTILVAAFIAIAGTVAFVIVLDILLWKRLRARRASILSLLIISIGVALALRHAIQIRFGPQVNNLGRPVSQPLSLGTVTFVPTDVLIIGVAVGLIAAVHLFLKHTRVGKSMRALADNPDLAKVSGVDVDRIILYVWAIAGSLATVAGVLLAYWRPFKTTLGWELLLPTFAAVILGGIGSALGALAGAYAIGFAMDFSTVWIAPSYKQAVAFVILISVLLVRPQGILGGKID